MLTNGNVQHVVKHSMSYGFVLTQPFSFYVDAYPMLQNEILAQTEKVVYGQHNDAVRMLQHKLNELSYYDKSIDGDFGVLTEYALLQFQKEHNLTTNAKADQETLDTIKRIERERYLQPLESINETYHPGDTGEDIKAIQNALYYFGYYTSEIDGIYGPITDKALKQFQKDHGIEVEEEVNQKTINTIYQAEDVDSANNNETKNKEEKNDLESEKKEVKKVPAQSSYDVSELISTAKQFIGTPYVWGGESRGGFDCSGYIQYVFGALGVKVPRTVSDIWNMSRPVDKLSVGDLVFYETYKTGPSHMGIYLGNGQFIHAGASNGVEISDMNIDYWQQRYLGAKRVVAE